MRSIKWFSKSDVVISSAGKHELQFDPEFPLMIFPYICEPDENDLTVNNHPFLEINYIHEGSGTYTVNDRIYTFKAGDVFMVGPAEFHTQSNLNRRTFKSLTLFFTPDIFYVPGGTPLFARYLAPFFERLPGAGNKVPLKKQERGRIKELILGMMDEMDEKKDEYKISVHQKLSAIILMILRACPPSLFNNRVHVKREDDLKRLEPVLAYLKENFKEQVSLRKAAQVANMSPSRFHYFFKKTTGQSPGDYIASLRIDRAKHLLRSTNLSVLEIVYETGFNNASSFYRTFRNKVRMSPNRLRASKAR